MTDDLSLTQAILGNEDVVEARRPRERKPAGWEEGLRWDGTEGTVTTVTQDPLAPVLADILREDSIDPDTVRIVGTVEHNRWQTASGETRHGWRYRFVSKDTESLDPAEVAALLDRALEPQPIAYPAPGDPEAFVFAPADLQAGKFDFDGTEGMVRRFKQAVTEALVRVDMLRRMGRNIPTLYIPCLGDLIEGCDGHYAMQTFTVQLNRRDQVKLVRRLLWAALVELAPHFERVVFLSVPGNHGENRKDYKAFTDFSDNDDVAIVEQIAETAAESDRMNHVSFVIPTDELHLTLDLHGTITTFAHGHQFNAKNVVGLESKAEAWWARQAHSMLPAGDSTLLMSGHFHHLRVIDFGPKWWVQAPALESGSKYFADANGARSMPGILSLVVGNGGWRDLAVLGSKA